MGESGAKRKGWAQHANLGVCLEYAGGREGRRVMITGESGENTGDGGVECWLCARHVMLGKPFNY